MQDKRPQAVFLAAAKVGGILANDTQPAEFIRENLLIEANIIHEALRVGVEKLLFLGSSCVYPKYAPQPIREESLLSGPLEPTNRAYAVAKIAGIELCRPYAGSLGAISYLPCQRICMDRAITPNQVDTAIGQRRFVHDNVSSAKQCRRANPLLQL